VKLLVGLGNPGAKYETTRHNAGFLVLDELASSEGIQWLEEKFLGDFAKGSVLNESCVLLKPKTFMNLSGRSVAQAARFFKVDVSDIVVMHDDIDMEAGKVKVRTGGGHGGHNGIKSIVQESGCKDFHRIKIGVGRPKRPEEGDVTNWVLGALSEQELMAYQSSVLDEVKQRLTQLFKSQ